MLSLIFLNAVAVVIKIQLKSVDLFLIILDTLKINSSIRSPPPPGLMELNGSCSQLIIELLKNFMLNQNVMLSVKGVVKNVHTVSVEKCSGNGAVSIADKLVMYGLAKNITSKKQTTSYKGIFFHFDN